MNRCMWVKLGDPLYVAYHDNEWGRPIHDDRTLYEMLLLETFQAGLSWECILKKREAFRAAYDGFDINKVVRYGEQKITELLSDRGIIRNRAKIVASVKNSIVFKNIQAEFGSFDAFLWGFTDGRTVIEPYTLRTTSPLSDAVSAELRRRGMRFVGSTTIYAYLQSVGIINGHGEECDCRRAVQ